MSGQVIDAIGGPKLVNEVGTLNQSRKVLPANAGYGLGSYSQVLGVKLTIPAVALPGTYRAIMTTTITTGPWRALSASRLPLPLPRAVARTTEHRRKTPHLFKKADLAPDAAAR